MYLDPLPAVNWDDVLSQGLSKYAEADRPNFLLGAELFRKWILGGGGDALDPQDGGDTIGDLVTDFTVFLKREFYDHETVKAPRYITSPALVGRACLFCAFHPAEDAVIQQLAQVLAKGLTRQQICQRLGSRGGDPCGEGHTEIWGTDLSSMERLVSGWMQEHIEHKIISHIYKSLPEGARICQFFRHLLGSAILNGPSLKLMVDSMRYSGTQQTSIGNALCNIVWSSILMYSARYGKVVEDIGEAKAALEIIMENGIFEGDDGFIRVRGGDDRERFVRTSLDLGLDLKFECRAGGAPSSNFCQLIYTQVSGVLTVLGDPAKIAARLSYMFTDKYKHTLKFDEPLQIAKLFSYAERFRGCPVVSQIIVTFLKHYAVSVQALLKLMRDQTAVDNPLRHAVAEQLADRGRWVEVDLLQKANDFEILFNDIDSISVVPPGVYEVMANNFGYAAEQLRKMHHEASVLVADGCKRFNGKINDMHITLPSLGEKFQNIRSRVCEVYKIDERGNARESFLDQAKTKCGRILHRVAKRLRNQDSLLWDVLQVVCFVATFVLSCTYGVAAVSPLITMAFASPWLVVVMGLVGCVGFIFFSLIMYLIFGAYWLRALRCIIWAFIVSWFIYIVCFSPLRHLQGWVRKRGKGILGTFRHSCREWAQAWRESIGLKDMEDHVYTVNGAADRRNRGFQANYLRSHHPDHLYTPGGEDDPQNHGFQANHLRTMGAESILTGEPILSEKFE